MRKITVMLIIILVITLIPTISTGNTRIMEQFTSYCQSGEQISGGVNQGEKVEVRIKVLIDEEKELSLFSGMKYPVFYLEEEIVSENNSLKLLLTPGTHTIRAVGMIPSGAEGQAITLLGCDNLGRYITSHIISPYILKEAETIGEGL